MKIFDYDTNRIEDSLIVGHKVRIEGNSKEVNKILNTVTYKEVAEGHEDINTKRVYIEIEKSDIEMYYNKKEFSKKHDYDDTKIRIQVWDGDGGLYIEAYTLNNENEDKNFDTVAYSKSVEENENNTKYMLKEAKKLYTKLKKWNYEIEFIDKVVGV